jgi:AcrR family transcriptional regulator
MSPRPRTASDDEILAAAARAIGRVGPHRLTLADVAAECGLAPATLVQRFGSRRGLLLAVAGHDAGRVGDELAALAAAYPSPLDALHAYAGRMAGMAASPGELANHLAFLQLDLTDPDFHALALRHARAVREGVHRILDAAVEAGELAPCDTGRLAGSVQAVLSGSLLTWAIFREGSAEGWVQDHLSALLDPLRA